VVNRWQGRPVEQLSSVELVAGVNELIQETFHYLSVLQTGILGTAGLAEGVFSAVYEKLARREGDPPASAFVIGYDSIPIQAEKALFDLAGWCRREHPALARYLLEVPTPQLAASLATSCNPGTALAEIETGLWEEWLDRIRSYLQLFGHSLYDLDFSKPTPADDPAPILETFKLYLTGGGRNPYQRQSELASQREQAVQKIGSRLKGLRLKLFQKALNFAQTCAPLREDCIADIGLGYPLLRQMLLELGQRFTTSGLISQPADIYWLQIDEVNLAVGDLDKGYPVRCLDEQVRERKAVWEAQKRLTPPPILPVKSKIAGINMEKWLPVDASQQTGEVIKGVGASPGQVTGTARVLLGPQEFKQMQPGDILVAAITTPAWTPLFAMASAVVTDVGGPLSHGSIVAREYGIPAVMGTGVATKRIRSGQIITVDGTSGLVSLSSGGSGNGKHSK
jgi:pyruvate,water dikinase